MQHKLIKNRGEKSQKINKTKHWYIENINNIDKTLAGLTTKNREKSQFTNIRIESWVISMDPTDIKRIIEEYYEQLYAYKFHNLDEMNQFLKRNYYIS